MVIVCVCFVGRAYRFFLVRHQGSWLLATGDFFFFREREHGHKWWGDREEGKRESSASSMLSTEPEAGLELPFLRSRSELNSRVGCLTDSASGAPKGDTFLMKWGKPEEEQVLWEKMGYGFQTDIH